MDVIIFCRSQLFSQTWLVYFAMFSISQGLRDVDYVIGSRDVQELIKGAFKSNSNILWNDTHVYVDLYWTSNLHPSFIKSVSETSYPKK